MPVINRIAGIFIQDKRFNFVELHENQQLHL
jgi:hypothetical protein